jgi:hypothetical protein
MGALLRLRALQLPLLWSYQDMARGLAPLTSLRELVLLVPGGVRSISSGVQLGLSTSVLHRDVEGGSAMLGVGGIGSAHGGVGGSSAPAGPAAAEGASCGVEEQGKQQLVGVGIDYVRVEADAGGLGGSDVLRRALRNCWIRFE